MVGEYRPWSFPYQIALLFTTQSQLLMTQKQKAFKNIVKKGENAGYQHFLLFPQCFLLIQ